MDLPAFFCGLPIRNRSQTSGAAAVLLTCAGVASHTNVRGVVTGRFGEYRITCVKR